MAAISGVYNRTINNLRQATLNLFGGRNKTFTISNPKTIERIKWIGREISTPENRLILGATALASQPFIDSRNKTLDEEIKGVVVMRTIAKIIVGTTTGVIIRKGCIKAIDYMTKAASEIKNGTRNAKWQQFLRPTIEKIDPQELINYKKTIGSLLALGVMLFTNFLIDAPLTQVLTNVMVRAKYSKNGGKQNAESK